MAEEQPPEPEKVQVKVGFRIPSRMPSVYAHHLLIQPGESEVIVSFFEIIPPIFLDENLDERTKNIQETGITAECVARITISLDRFPRFANAMMQVAEQIKDRHTQRNRTMPTIQRTREKIRQFTQLPEGWHFGEGAPPSEDARSVASTLLLRAESFDFGEVDAFPGVNGEIQIVVYAGTEDDYEFTIERNGTIMFAHDRDGQEHSSRVGLSLAEAIETLEHLGNQAWRSSDLFTTIILTQAEVDLGAWLSKTPVTGQAFLLSTENVLNVPAGQFVNISPDITQQWLVSPSFTGKYLTTSSLPNALLSSGIVSQVTHATTISDIGVTRLLDDSLKRCA